MIAKDSNNQEMLDALQPPQSRHGKAAKEQPKQAAAEQETKPEVPSASETAAAEAAPKVDEGAVKLLRADINEGLNHSTISSRIRDLSHEEKVEALAALISKDPEQVLDKVGPRIGVYDLKEATLLAAFISSDRPGLVNPVSNRIIKQLLSTNDDDGYQKTMTGTEKTQLLTEACELAAKTNPSVSGQLLSFVDKYAAEKKSTAAVLGSEFGKDTLESLATQKHAEDTTKTSAKKEEKSHESHHEKQQVSEANKENTQSAEANSARTPRSR